ncbi:MAG: hypothetical protein EOO43_08350 [Flavobacterium sp.]|nr:MAG: hypothetical protein EOO43_08350 [Flavobacterium sp.]
MKPRYPVDEPVDNTAPIIKNELTVFMKNFFFINTLFKLMNTAGINMPERCAGSNAKAEGSILPSW